jgi:hypothetical protein
MTVDWESIEREKKDCKLIGSITTNGDAVGNVYSSTCKY